MTPLSSLPIICICKMCYLKPDLLTRRLACYVDAWRHAGKTISQYDGDVSLCPVNAYRRSKQTAWSLGQSLSTPFPLLLLTVLSVILSQVTYLLDSFQSATYFHHIHHVTVPNCRISVTTIIFIFLPQDISETCDFGHLAESTVTVLWHHAHVFYAFWLTKCNSTSRPVAAELPNY